MQTDFAKKMIGWEAVKTVRFANAPYGLDILLVKQNGQVMLRQLLNLRPAQEQVITLLGPQVQKCYLFGS
jgi:hypothetical protein